MRSIRVAFVSTPTAATSCKDTSSLHVFGAELFEFKLKQSEEAGLDARLLPLASSSGVEDHQTPARSCAALRIRAKGSVATEGAVLLFWCTYFAARYYSVLSQMSRTNPRILSQELSVKG